MSSFSHIRPQPGIGYDERRYVSLWGRLQRRDGRLVLARPSGSSTGTSRR